MRHNYHHYQRRSLWLSLLMLYWCLGCTASYAQISLTATGGSPTGSFANVNEAFAAINAGTHTGAIVISVNGNTTEPATPVPLLASGQGSASYTTILIKPTTVATVSGAVLTGRGVLELDGADNVTIDGSITTGGTTRDLTIQSTAATTVDLTACVRLIGRTTGGLGAINNTIRNCVIIGNTPGNNGTSGSTITGSFGIYAGSNTTITTAGTGADYDNLSIINNEVRRAYRGIYVQSTITEPANNLNISQNVVGSSTVADYVAFRGIVVGNVVTGLIEQNEVFNLKVNTFVSNAGIEVIGTTSSTSDVAISRNRIYGLESTNTSGYGSYGINIFAGTNHVIVNNLVYDIRTVNYNSASTTFQAFGIRLAGGTGHRVYYNSVHLYGQYTTGSSTTNALSAAFVVTSIGVTGLDIRNNIFANKMTSTAATPFFYAVWFPNAYDFANAVLNNNAYYVSNTPRHFVGKIGTIFGTADYQTLANWRAISQVNNAGNDISSIPDANGDAPFTADNTLTIPASTVTPAESGGAVIGAPLPSPNVDYTGANRPAGTGIAPDMGAYEFAGVNPNLCSGTPASSDAVLSANNVCAGQNVIATLSTSYTAAGIAFQWQSAPTIGGTYTDISGATSAAYIFTASNASFALRCRVTCLVSGLSVISTPIALNINSAVYATVPFSENFENTWATTCVVAPLGQDTPNNSWRTVPSSGNNSWRADNTTLALSGWSSLSGAYTPTGAQGSSRSARFHTFNTSSGVQGSLDLYVNLSAAGNKQLNFDYINTSGTDVLAVLLSEDGGQTFTPVTTSPATLGVQATWTAYTATLTSTSATAVIRFRATSDFGSTDIGLDNVSISLPCNGTPTAGTTVTSPSTVCFPRNVVLSLTGASIGAGISYQWQSSPNGVDWTNISGATGSTASVAVSATTQYRCVVTCANPSPSSANSTPATVTVVTPTYATVPYTQGFESVWGNSSCVIAPQGQDIPDASWRNVNTSGDPDASWRADNTTTVLSGWTSIIGAYTPTGAQGSSRSARFHSYDVSTGLQGSLDLFVNLSVAGNKLLSFDYINPVSTSDRLEVFLSEDGGLTFSPLTTTPALAPGGTPVPNWTNVSATLTSTSATAVIRFRGTGDFGSGAADIGLDNVSIVLPCSGTPIGGTLNITSQVACSATTLSVTGATAGSGITYQWQSSTTSATTDFTDITGATGISYIAPQPTQAIWYRRRITCTNSGESSLSTVGQLLPPPAISTYPYTENFDGVTGVSPTLPPSPINIPNNGAMPCGWSVLNANNDNFTWKNAATTNAATAPNALVYNYNTDGVTPANDWAFSPGFVMTLGKVYTLSFKYRVENSGFPEALEVRWGTSQTVAGMPVANQIFNNTNLSNTTYLTATATSIAPTTSGTYFVGFYAKSIADQWNIYIDDVQMTEACPTATITPTNLTAGVYGAAYNQAISQTGFSAATWSATGLPAGLSINTATGAITGTPTVTGTFNVVVTATNQASCTATRNYSLLVACPSYTFAPTTLAQGVIAASYSQTLSTTPTLLGTAAWSVSAGTLPAGLSLNASTGAITGTPTATGTSNFTVQVTDGVCTATQAYSIVVVCPTITIAPTTLPNATVGASYSQTITQTGLPGTAAWSVSAGTLPAGLSLNASTGAITGTPTANGTSNFTVQVTDGVCTATQAYSLTVVCPTASLLPTSLPNATVGFAYNQSITQTGLPTNTGTVVWSVSAGTLPAGLSLDVVTGAITGTPTTAGTSNFTIQAAVGNCTATRDYSLVAACPTVTITPATLPNAVVATAYSQTFTQVGLAGTPVWNISAGTLPAGFTLSSAGVLSGTPTTTGTSNFTVRVVSGNCEVTQTYALTVVCPTIAIAPASLPNAVVTFAYNRTLTASGGIAPYSFVVSAGTLPAGLSLSSAGVLSGTPTTTGTSNFTVRATDANGCTATQAYTFTVEAITRILTITNTTLDFGTVAWGQSSARTLPIQNTGNSPLTINRMIVSSPQFVGVFSGIIAPGATANVPMVFVPNNTGAFTANVSFESNATSGANTVVNLTGTGDVATSLDADLRGGLSVSPNPSTGLFNIRLSAIWYGSYRVSVVDMQGKMVYVRAVDIDGDVQLDLSGVAAGNYVLSLDGVKGKASVRIQKY